MTKFQKVVYIIVAVCLVLIVVKLYKGNTYWFKTEEHSIIRGNKYTGEIAIYPYPPNVLTDAQTDTNEPIIYK